MSGSYLPPSEFLNAIIDETVSFTGGEFGAANLAKLIEMTRDTDSVNRDWAAFLLAQLEMNLPNVRAALLAAARDENGAVRAEAIWGLARIDPCLALPFVQTALSEEVVSVPVFDAAALCAHASLIPDLECFAIPSGNTHLDEAALKALAACESGIPSE